MINKTVNTLHLEGLLYEHDLEFKVSGEASKNPGTQYISGTVKVATDDKCLNIVEVHYTYVTATTKKGGPNPTYTTLKGILDGKFPTVMGANINTASKVRIDTSFAANDFYSTRSGDYELVSAKVNEGGFIHCDNNLTGENNRFDVDIIINKAVHVDADEEKGVSEKTKLFGYVFNFRKELQPVEMIVTHPGAMSYFESYGVSDNNCLYTHLSGSQISETVIKKQETESPWGEIEVREVKTSRKALLVNHASAAYDWEDDEKTEFKKMLADRETYLATVKQRQIDYEASKGNSSKANTSSNSSSNDTFNF